MAHAIAVTAKTAAEPAEQINDHDDDQYHSERHGTLPKGWPADGTPPQREKHISPFGSSEGTSVFSFPMRSKATSVIPGWRGSTRHQSLSQNVANRIGLFSELVMPGQSS